MTGIFQRKLLTMTFLSVKHGQRMSLSESKRMEGSWQVMAAVCLERHPLLSPPLSDLQSRYMDMMAQTEYEQSLLSPHEIRKSQDKIRAEKVAKGEVDPATEEKQIQTAQDFQDMAREDRLQFKAAERLEQSSSDTESLERSLTQKLVFVVKQKLDDRDIPTDSLCWSFPRAFHSQGETLRQTAERALENQEGAKILGNAPVGFYKYKYPKNLPASADFNGAKVFFYKAHLLPGVHKFSLDNSAVVDYKWLNHEELPQHFPKLYHLSVSKFLVE